MQRNSAMHALIGLTVVAAVAMNESARAQDLSERISTVIQQRAAKQATAKGPILRALLTTGVTVKFEQTKARDAFAYFKQLLGADMVVRWSDDPGASAGLDPETPITLEMTNAQALVVLERMIEMCSADPATWQLRQGYLEVGPKVRLNARGAQETRIYPIRDLLFEAPNFDNAPEFNLNQSVQTGGGGGGGGTGGGGGGGFGGGGGGSGGGGGGGGGGGSPFGNPGESPARRATSEKADELIELIKSLVETDAWLDESVASIRYYDGSIIVRAPDYIQRQIAGYGWISDTPRATKTGGRYVDMTTPIGISQVTGFRGATVTGAAGGGGTGGAGGGGTGGPGGAGGGPGGGNFIPGGGGTPTSPGGSGAPRGSGATGGGGAPGGNAAPGGSGAGNKGGTPPTTAPGGGTKP